MSQLSLDGASVSGSPKALPLAALLLAACSSVPGTSDAGTNGGVSSCGQGTVQVGNVCKPVGASSGGGSGSSSGGGSATSTSGLTILNGASAATSSTHWAVLSGVIAFYADGTGTYASATGQACPGVCLAPLAQCGASDGGCTDPRSDSLNCGSCGQQCPANNRCSAGACVAITCGAGCTLQDGGCVCPGSPSGPTLGGNGQPAPFVVTFTWSEVGTGAILLSSSGPTSTINLVPFANLTQITGGVSQANFTAVANGGTTDRFTLVSGPACKSQ